LELGCTVDRNEGLSDGDKEGATDGLFVDMIVGVDEATRVGFEVGKLEGLRVGPKEG